MHSSHNVLNTNEMKTVLPIGSDEGEYAPKVAVIGEWDMNLMNVSTDRVKAAAIYQLHAAIGAISDMILTMSGAGDSKWTLHMAVFDHVITDDTIHMSGDMSAVIAGVDGMAIVAVLGVIVTIAVLIVVGTSKIADAIAVRTVLNSIGGTADFDM